ncbi:MAG: PSD1 and planctomycete cytochrome C domain-containing protein, partial [Planctomycetota bacterium]|nr:PSD1 and planctomycete cytochrome C domain-containing protein [Planctomycetota bacterium]
MILILFSVAKFLTAVSSLARPLSIRASASVLLFAAVGPSAIWAATSEETDFFEQHIRPIFHTYCTECHGAEKQESGLRVDRREAFFAGSDSGPVLSSEANEGDLFFEAISYKNEDLQMPPDGPLPPEALALVRQWIEMGAPWPTDPEEPGGASPIERIDEIQSSHWALQPITPPEIPEVQNTAWPNNGIDFFILAQQEANGLSPSPRASSRQLLRRASFDMLGLPPTAEERDRFFDGEGKIEWDSFVDHLLDRPEYGQRWARHWLDVARYADTKGYIGVGKREERYAYGWTYRDYVVRALNEDVPFDDFIRHQLAADLLDLEEEEQWKLAAMGFLTLGNRFIHKRHRIVGDQIDVTMRGFQGLTLMCARCHDHKFDPIDMDDYYALYGIFDSSIEPSYDQKPLLTEEPPLEDAQYANFKKVFDKRITKYHEQRVGLRQKIRQEMRSYVGDYLEFVVHETMPAHRTKTDLNYKTERTLLRRHNLVADGGVVLWTRYIAARENDPIFGLWHRLARLDPAAFSAEAGELIASADQANPRLRAALEQAAPSTMIDVAQTYGEVLEAVHAEWQKVLEVDPGDEGFENQVDEQLRLVLYGDGSPAVVDNDEQAYNLYHIGEKNNLRSLQQEAQNTLVQFIDTVPARAMTLIDRDLPRDAAIHIRGDWRRKGPTTSRRFLKLLSGAPFEAVDSGEPYMDGSGRLQLAEAIASPHNPLTARVIANRIWQWHFGEGLVATPSDFGVRSSEPVQRELLDYLAAYLIEHDWSLKSLHRLITHSATYQQASADDAEKRAIDPSNQFYWRMNRRRLEFEAMRDALLAVSGELDTDVGGLPTEDFGSGRRSIYLLVNRQQMPGVLATFDVSVPDATLPMRNKTTVPQQALYLMNNRFLADRARQLIARLDRVLAESSAPQSLADRVGQLYDWVYGRQPNEYEQSLAEAFLSVPLADAPQSLAVDEKQMVWEYGTGKIDSDSGELIFRPFEYFDGKKWREKEKITGPPYLSAKGGCPSDDHAVVRRFTAPEEGLYLFKGRVNLMPEAVRGDGI